MKDELIKHGLILYIHYIYRQICENRSSSNGLANAVFDGDDGKGDVNICLCKFWCHGQDLLDKYAKVLTRSNNYVVKQQNSGGKKEKKSNNN